MPIALVTIEKAKMLINIALVKAECLCSPIILDLLPRMKMHATVAGSKTELNACETIITTNGRASKIGTTKPRSEMKNTMIRYFGNVISRSELL